MVACNQGGNMQNLIVFADAVGTYTGTCIANTPSSLDTFPSEISIFAITIDKAGIKGDCLNNEWSVNVLNANGQEIDFEGYISDLTCNATFYAANDSIFINVSNNQNQTVLSFSGTLE